MTFPVIAPNAWTNSQDSTSTTSSLSATTRAGPLPGVSRRHKADPLELRRPRGRAGERGGTAGRVSTHPGPDPLESKNLLSNARGVNDRQAGIHVVNRPRAMRCGDMRHDLRVLPGGDRFSPRRHRDRLCRAVGEEDLVRLRVEAPILESTVRVLASRCRGRHAGRELFGRKQADDRDHDGARGVRA